MKKIIISLITALSLTANASELKIADYNKRFKGFDACFILFDLNANKILSEYNPNNRCNERISPNSTFKIPLSLMAFDHGVITQSTVFKWDGEVRSVPDWNQDLTPKTWIKYSAVWVSQYITPLLGYQRISHYLAQFNYGNQNFSGDPGKNNGLTYAWLSSSLKISALEQLHFLMAMLTNQWSLSNDAIAHTRENMYLGKLDNGFDYFAKTGSGRHGRNERMSNPSSLRDGWFVGFIENKAQRYIFVSNLTDLEEPSKTDKAYGSFVLKPIVLGILNDYFKEKI